MKYLLLIMFSFSLQAQEQQKPNFFQRFAKGYQQATQNNNYQEPQIIPPQVNIQQQQPQFCTTHRNALTGAYYTQCQ